LRVLLIAEQCNPEWPSVPLVAYRLYETLSHLVDVTLVTHARNRQGLEKPHPDAKVHYISESALLQRYYGVVKALVGGKRTIWQLYHTLSYPIYEEFNQKVYGAFKDQVLAGEFDIVHVLTPMMPRYPSKMVKACHSVPFILGPVNGGVPFPPGFEEKAKAEFASLNFLRAIGRYLLPGYIETYRKADKVLAGSTYTYNDLQAMFAIADERMELVYENGILDTFFNHPKPSRTDDRVNLLFVGRLVPYKCADIAIDAIARVDKSIRQQLRFTIVGDGAERAALEQQVKRLNLEDIVHFVGWVKPDETLNHYATADIFCFPSIREFGGAVVMEAMACGLPCIVVNNGGIGEYVTDQTGFRIEPISREYVTRQVAEKIALLVEQPELRQRLSAAAINRARNFVWSRKAEQIVQQYYEAIAQKQLEDIPALAQGSF